jgi:hypothetical protein
MHAYTTGCFRAYSRWFVQELDLREMLREAPAFDESKPEYLRATKDLRVAHTVALHYMQLFYLSTMLRKLVEAEDEEGWEWRKGIKEQMAWRERQMELWGHFSLDYGALVAGDDHGIYEDAGRGEDMEIWMVEMNVADRMMEMTTWKEMIMEETMMEEFLQWIINFREG